MEILNLIDTFSEFKEFKNIDREAMMHIIEDVFKAMLAKKYGSDEYFNIIVNIDKGVLEIYHNRTVVEDGNVEDPLSEIEYSEAIKIEPDFEVGEEVSEVVDIKDFGRREILAIRQNLQTKVMEFEKENIFLKYKDKVGEIITAEVYQVWRKEILIVDEDGIELTLPKAEQIPSDNYKKGDTIRAIVKSVENKNGSPVIILSRTSEIFLQRLFEMEVPEVYDGLITIRKIVREPGQRAKIAVESYDDRIDPVGACVGMKGSRIHGIVRELRNENIDVINYTTKPDLFITRALSPAKISSIVIDDAKKVAEVYMENDQVSLAIGKGGYNIKLAGKLTGYEIDVYRNTEEAEMEDDVDLKEFVDEIDEWIIDSLRNMGCDTAKSVLAYTAEEIATRADLEIETVVEIIDILKAEFEDDEQ
ncbi:MAG: transcription termination/antitermination protein NusA [Lentimicrobiaceae bacterium]|nr:transcription termination/antitermination protein NusA [Lentimicrobiaceae bacterium]MBQ4549259.1 transcription termination/antitermination protein NusA [Bacteroidales bacterium]MBR2051399.1 transcription termination/antitermination protein NusA [Bacteroidales bacterium]